MKNNVAKKLKLLENYLGKLGKLAVAFSGGTDSSFLLYMAHKILGNKTIAFTVKSPYIAQWEVDEAIVYTKKYGIRHKIIEVPFNEQIRNNPLDRCYICKHNIFMLLKKEAASMDFQFLADGTNYDDLSDYRPGLKALKELEIKSPLLECEITKNEIREISKDLNIPTWNKPAYACLLTRLPFDTEICFESLTKIEKAEKFLIDNNIKAVRVREHGNIARIETTESNFKLLLNSKLRINIIKFFKNLGYNFVCFDLEGYRTGSMKEK